MAWPKQKPEDDDGVPFSVDEEIEEENEFSDALQDLGYDPPVEIPDAYFLNKLLDMLRSV